MKWRGKKRAKVAMAPDYYGGRPEVGILSEFPPIRIEDVFGNPSDEECLWRMKGYLDCLRALKLYGEPDPLFVEYLVEKTGEKAP